MVVTFRPETGTGGVEQAHGGQDAGAGAGAGWALSCSGPTVTIKAVSIVATAHRRTAMMDEEIPEIRVVFAGRLPGDVSYFCRETMSKQ